VRRSINDEGICLVDAFSKPAPSLERPSLAPLFLRRRHRHHRRYGGRCGDANDVDEVAFCVLRSPFFVLCSLFFVRRSSFAVLCSPFAVRRSLFAVRRSLFAVRRSPFAVRRYESNAETKRRWSSITISNTDHRSVIHQPPPSAPQILFTFEYCYHISQIVPLLCTLANRHSVYYSIS